MFDSSPYAPDTNFLFSDVNFKMFKLGLSYLSKMTEGTVHINCRAGGQLPMAGMPKNVKINNFDGPHPSGNPGIQIHHLDPIKDKISGLGIDTLEVDGHNIGDLNSTFEKSKKIGKLNCILARTVKGKGSSIMENKKNWHYWNPMSEEEIKKTRKELT